MPTDEPVRLVVGLGNPGSRYARTRHNVGQDVVLELAARLGAGRAKRRYGGQTWEAGGPTGPVALLVPETYMNESGRSVGPAAGSVHAAPAQVLVVHDEIDIEFGEVRGKAGGGTAGHNGLRSVEQGLGSREFLRVRVGVGRPGPGWRGSEADWLLSRFSEDAADVTALRAGAADMAELVIAEGMAAAIERFHARPPGERARARAARREAGPAEPEGGGGPR